MKKDKDLKNITNFLFEVGILNHTPRSGLHFLGTGSQSVAEHMNRVVYIGYTLANMDKKADMKKVLQMCFLHDLTETRISDLNYVHQKYVTRHEKEAIEDLSKTLPFGKNIKETILEYETRTSLESHIAKDADNLEWILTLKEQQDSGNERARDWIVPAIKRLKTKNAKKIANMILKTDSNEWWFNDKEDKWWVNRNK